MVWLLASVLLVALIVFLGRRLPRTSPPPDPPLEAGGAPDSDYALQVDDELDLHGVEPREVELLVEAFVDDARVRGRLQIKIVHGKGTGTRRAQVRTCLARLPGIASFGDATSPGSGWGATVVDLEPPSDVAPGEPRA